ncbi:TDP-N-acetylfucosamine:lipid II N-acetylfucosaminyltransferase [Pseudoalteromonas ostreae]|uniref:TDP-N-acetylfucosamine:lipid II N-acetylfucosaminyltransferase n=1 Tax=Pseudoalteromonas ostreae TaxID=2774154 RepID=UPI001B39545D|nr:TDP-N-acetylfucosamine:lipid II N-acetylfucosaminyltransferase [Pseudoalteromonas ostreae]
MRSKKILHVAECDKFIPPFIDFVNKHFEPTKHEFMLTGGMSSGNLKNCVNVHLSGESKLLKLKHYFSLILKMHQADKVILHGLFNIKIVQILFFAPWLLKKCCWVIWGGDLYTYQFGLRNKKWLINEFFRRPVIKKIGHLVTYIEGDIALARKWYGATGKYQECLMYTSNLYKEYEVSESKKTSINIQVGNSADPSNNHIEALEKLLPFKERDICIFVPLSYGSKEYAKQVITQGKEWFGDKFKPFTEFMPFEQYLSLLGSIDIAIFNHKRQQAMGNTIALLGLGKTVYLRSDTSQWPFFEMKGIKIGDIEKLNSLDSQKITGNVEIVKAYFSPENYKKQLTQLFDY